ncbi:hypothetical protein CTAYLR_010434 [Chrysophaeum taylorii]|uniref:Carbohydrate kinase PfkB domain-containing protein n=1 Tax=Chrysophaeum taylorii TaxID=2483200 RepID=A0AAD7U9H4_9STRA|nr:hypothetical protein CTAYLR_010434 [Chrysophaeum taylorii]
MSTTTLEVSGAASGVDSIAEVEAFPQPDDKIRASRTTTGGGAGNAMVAAARLGWQVRRRGVVADLETEHVDISNILRGGTTGHTLVIVASSTATRAPFRSPQSDSFFGRPRPRSRASPTACCTATRGAALELARRASCLVTVDAEKERDGLDDLLRLADVVLTNSRFPGPDLATGMARLLENRAPRARAGVAIWWRNREFALEDREDVVVDFSVCRDDTTSTIPARPEIVDTTSAGDALVGCALVGLARGWPLETAVFLGTLVAKLAKPTARARASPPRQTSNTPNFDAVSSSPSMENGVDDKSATPARGVVVVASSRGDKEAAGPGREARSFFVVFFFEEKGCEPRR